MNIICISRGSESKGKGFAVKLAQKLGYEALCREDLVEAAIKEGITVGRLETAMLKPQLINETLLLEKEHYQAFATATICERALAGNILYHGRTGHLLLPGVTHVMKIRVVESQEAVIDAVMARMNVSWAKAKRYVEDVDEDVHRWVKTYYNADWNQLTHFNVVLNLDEMSVGNAATAMCSMAALPEFQSTPATRKVLADLLLASRVRIALARNERTSKSRFHVTADQGVVSVSYQPQDEKVADMVPGVVSTLEGVSELHCTMASSYILWIQERFEDCTETCDQVMGLARRYNAAVELVRYVPGQDAETIAQANAVDAGAPGRSRENGGIEDDVAEVTRSEEDVSLRRAYDRLVQGGVAGGSKVVSGPTGHLVDSLNARVSYFIVVVGELFMDKGHAARVRMTRELSGAISERLRAPVVGMDELKKTMMFGPRQAMQLVVTMLLSAVLFLATFVFQIPILEFLREEGMAHRAMAAAALAVLVSVFAYLYGTFAHNVLKLVKME